MVGTLPDALRPAALPTPTNLVHLQLQRHGFPVRQANHSRVLAVTVAAKARGRDRISIAALDLQDGRQPRVQTIAKFNSRSRSCREMIERLDAGQEQVGAALRGDELRMPALLCGVGLVDRARRSRRG